jgi:hypothetical protein
MPAVLEGFAAGPVDVMQVHLSGLLVAVLPELQVQRSTVSKRTAAAPIEGRYRIKN